MVEVSARKGLRAMSTSTRTRTNSLVSVSNRRQQVSRTADRRQRRSAAVVVQAAASPDTVKWVGNKRPLDLNKSYYPKKEDVDKQKKVWYIIDAEGQTLGRLATLVSMYLRGKHLPSFSPSMDTGGYVVVVNCDKVAVSGRKATDKMYYYHRVHRPGTMKTETFKDLKERIPERIIERAVRGMLPKGRLGNELFTSLKCYSGAEHPHGAQKPLDITNLINKKPKDADLTAVRQAVGLE
jgi:large subunit ribosomal protein L13